MTDEDVPVSMTREFIRRQTLVWLEVEGIPAILAYLDPTPKREKLAESLTNHLVNNALQLQVAEKEERIRGQAEFQEGNKDIQHIIDEAESKAVLYQEHHVVDGAWCAHPDLQEER